MILNDALNDVRGRAGDGRILQADKPEDRLLHLLQGEKSVILKIDGVTENKLGSIRKILAGIRERKTDMQISIITKDNDVSSQISGVNHINENNALIGKEALTLNACDHIFRMESFNAGEMYIDHYLNIIVNDNDRSYCANFKQSYEFFYNIFYPSMVLRVKGLREKYGVNKESVR